MKPPGRLSRYQKDELSREESRLNPLMSSHDLYHCYDKGPQGSPTYDEAGFQLDYDKVAQWMKPQAYNKKRIMRGGQRSLARQQSDQEQMFRLFFQEIPKDNGMWITIKDYVKDYVSKDLNIPWHQINSEKVRLWREKGIQPVDYTQWWREPTAEEKKRFSKMLGGGSLRKDF